VTGARAGVVKAVVVNRARRESVSAEAAAGAEPRAIEVAVAGLRKLIKKEK
jgi:uridine phosphorylase